MRRDIPAVVAAVSLLLAGCGSGGSEPPDQNAEAQDASGTTSPTDQRVEVAVASYDLAVGEDRRFTAGLLLPDAGVLVGGEAEMRLFYLGEDVSEDSASLQRGAGDAVETATASFLAVSGLAPDPMPDEPEPGDGSAVGVYETTFDFDLPGRYGVGVIAEVDGEQVTGTAMFDVAAETEIVEVGEAAPLEPNPTMGSDVAPVVIDSRAQDGEAVPDPQLHETALEASLDAGNRAVVLLSTPVYCVSRFCGPITEQVEQLADELPADVDVIHIEVWQDFDEQQLHPAAAAWIQTEEGGNEPWLFVVDDDGTVIGRWDNVTDLAAVRDLLDA